MGPNGAGKSTLFNLIMGAQPLSGGTIEFAGQRISGLTASQICKMGIGRTYQIPQPFHNMTVTENLMVGQLYGQNTTAMGRARDRAYAILEELRLAHKAEVMAGQLGLLDLKRLEMARALSTGPAPAAARRDRRRTGRARSGAARTQHRRPQVERSEHDRHRARHPDAVQPFRPHPGDELRHRSRHRYPAAHRQERRGDRHLSR